MQNTIFSQRSTAIINALRASQPVTDREAMMLRDELMTVLDGIHEKLFTAEHAVAVSQQQKTGEVVAMLERFHFDRIGQRVG